MRIARVCVGIDLTAGAVVRLPPAQSHYLKNVLRLKSGAPVILFDGHRPREYTATIELDGKNVTARLGDYAESTRESPLPITLVLGLARADHVDWSIQKSTELGVGRICLFNASRTQTPLKKAQQTKKLDHWRAVAASACEQCGRSLIPRIEFYSDLPTALAGLEPATCFLLDFDAPRLQAALPEAVAGVALLLGPEGGLGPDEIESAKSTGFSSASLGPRVLRSETAVTAALAIVQAKLGDG